MATIKELVIKIKAQTDGLKRDLDGATKKLDALKQEASKASEKAEALAEKADNAAKKAKVLTKEVESTAKKLREMGGGSETAQIKLEKMRVSAQAAAARANELKKAASDAAITASTLGAQAQAAGAQAAGGMNQLGTASKGALLGISALKVAMGAFVGGALLQLTNTIAALPGQIINTAEKFNQLSARVLDTVGDISQAKVVMDALTASSNRTGQSLEGTIQGFVRLAPAGRELGKTNEDLIRFLETFQKMGGLAGATATEVNNAMIQLSQGLASGALRGDELRSVMEQMPQVARTIAESMGIPFSEFKKAAEEGRITAEEVFNAVINKSAEVDAAFSKLPPSITRSMNVITNQFGILIDSLNQSTHFTDLLALAFTNLAGVVVSATAQIKNHSQALLFMANAAINAGNKVFYGFRIIMGSIDALAAGTVGATLSTVQALVNAFTMLGGLKVNLGADKANKQFSNALRKVQNDTKLFNRSLDVSKIKIGEFNHATQMASAALAGGGASSSGSSGAGGAGGSGKRSVASGAREAAKAVNELNQAVSDTLPKLESLRIDATPEAIAKTTKQTMQVRGLSDPTGEIEAKLRFLEELDATEKDLMSIRELSPDAKAQLEAVSKQGEDMRQAFSGYLNDIGRNFENTFIEGIKNGKLNFKDFALSILEDLGRLIIRFGVINPIVQRFTSLLNGTGSAGGGGGGFLGFLGGLFKGGGGKLPAPVPSPPSMQIRGLATGGDLMPNRPYIVGERGPELIYPNKTGRVTNASGTRQQIGGQTVEPVIINQNFTVGVTPTVRAEIMNMQPMITRNVMQALDRDRRRGGQVTRSIRKGK